MADEVRGPLEIPKRKGILQGDSMPNVEPIDESRVDEVFGAVFGCPTVDSIDIIAIVDGKVPVSPELILH
jgi:hypothetical protein